MTAVAVEPMVTDKEVAEVLRVDERVIRRQCGKSIPGLKVGKSWRIPASWLAYVTSWSPGDEAA